MQRLPRSRVLLYSAILAALIGVAGRQVIAGAEAQRVTAATVQMTTGGGRTDRGAGAYLGMRAEQSGVWVGKVE